MPGMHSSWQSQQTADLLLLARSWEPSSADSTHDWMNTTSSGSSRSASATMSTSSSWHSTSSPVSTLRGGHAVGSRASAWSSAAHSWWPPAWASLSAVSPFLATSPTWAPSAARVRTPSVFPFTAAQCTAARPAWFTASMLAPLSARRRSMSEQPMAGARSQAAVITGVLPSKSRTFTSAPELRSRRAPSIQPACTALSRGEPTMSPDAVGPPPTSMSRIAAGSASRRRRSGVLPLVRPFEQACRRVRL